MRSARTVFPCFIWEMFRAVQLRRFLRRQSRPRLALAGAAAGLCIAGIAVFTILAARAPTAVRPARNARALTHRAVKLESRPARLVLLAPTPLSPPAPRTARPSRLHKAQG